MQQSCSGVTYPHPPQHPARLLQLRDRLVVPAQMQALVHLHTDPQPMSYLVHELVGASVAACLLHVFLEVFDGFVR